MTTKSKAQGGSRGKGRDEADEAARLLKRFANHKGTPDFLTNAVMLALNLAGNATGLAYWQVEPDNVIGDAFDMPGLAELLRTMQHPRFIGAAHVEPEGDLADHIAAVLADPKTPSRIYNALSEAVTESASKDRVQSRPEVIRVALALDGEEEGGRQ
jgi:hypothetical protein